MRSDKMREVRYRQGDLPTALLEAVEAAVRVHGVSALSLRDVTRRAGVSHGAPAHHFRNKAGLLTAFAAQGYESLGRTVAAEIAGAGGHDGAGVLAAIGRGYVRFAVEHPAHFEVMFRLDALDTDDPAFQASSEAAYSFLTTTIEQCRAEGRLGAHDPEIVTVSAWSLVHGLAALLISGRLSDRIREQDPHRLAAAVSALFVECVLDPPEPARDPGGPVGSPRVGECDVGR
jgi:AcrR family transcriptional regulator